MAVFLYVLTFCLWLVAGNAQSTCTLSPSCNTGNECLSDFRACLSKCDSNSVCNIEFQPGVYHWLFGKNSAQGVLIENLHNVNIYGSANNDIKIIIHGLNGAFTVYNCVNFTMTNLAFDMYRLPFTYGIVTNTNTASQQFTLQFNETEYQIEPDPYLNDGEDYKWIFNVEAILGYDPTARHPVYPDIYTQAPDSLVKSATINNADPAKSTMVIQTTGIHSISTGDHLIIRHQVYSYNFMSAVLSTDIQLVNVTVYTIPGMGFVASRCHNIELRSMRFIKYANRPMSLCADATHFSLTTGVITVDQSVFEGQGDDGLNVHNFFFQIDAKISSNSLYLQSRVNGSSIANMVRLGDTYEFRNRSSLQPYFTAKLVNLTKDNIATFDQDMPEEMRIYDVISSITSLPTAVYITNSVYHANRARGTLIKVSNVTIRNVSYINVTGPAILVRPEAAYWLESTVSHNVQIINNHVSNCNYGVAQENGTITIEAIVPVFNANGQPTTQEQALQFGQVHQTVNISGNVFDQCMDLNPNHNAISMRAVKDSYVNGNRFIEPGSQYVVLQKWNCGGTEQFENDVCVLPDGHQQACVTQMS